MREKFVLENSDFIGYRMTFENNNLPDLIFEEGKFSAELFEKFKKRRANLIRTFYTLFNNEISQPSRSKLSKLLNISQNGLKFADILHKKYLSTKMSEPEGTKRSKEPRAKMEEVNLTNISHDESLNTAATANVGLFRFKASS